jgi:hypothetical protein
MNIQKPRSILALLFSLSAGIQISAQDFTVDVSAVKKSYSADFSKAFVISFKDTSKTKASVVIKQGDGAATVLKENAVLANFTIKFSPASAGLTVADKDGKTATFAAKDLDVVIGEKSFTVTPSKAQSTDAKSPEPNPNAKDTGEVVIDVNGASEYKTDFKRNFKLKFKTKDTKPQDVVLSITSSSGTQKLTLAKQDLSKLIVSFTTDGGALSVDDAKGKPRLDDAKKPFKIDGGEFSVTVSKKNFKIKHQPTDQKKEDVLVKKSCPAVTIIDSMMLAGINGAGGCQLCDIRAKKIDIESKKDRLYNTDYIVIYDPMLTKDAYSVCKHIFEKKSKADSKTSGKKYFERYIKIGNKWFAPSVGSQIRFEVVNLPLNSSLKLSVDENDVFNGGASQFTSIINSLVGSNIINPLAGASKSKDSTGEKAGITGGEEPDCFLSDLDHIATDLLKYMTAFRVSSCAIEQHNRNLPIILTRINQSFNLSAATAEQLETLLTQKIDVEVKGDDKVKALKKAELIVKALQALEKVQPLAYTTLRAKNRDYIEVKYSDANNALSKGENIRMSGGMKIDFSAGFVLTGLRDYSYILKNVVYAYTPPALGSPKRDTTGNVIVKEDEGNNQVGVGLLTHFYPRSSSHYNLGGTVGLMTSTSLNLRLMLGGSLMVSSLFGSNNRVSFSGGVVWGKVKRLGEKDKDFFEHPRVVNGIPEFFEEASAPVPIDRNEHSWFFAVTLNFGGN